MEVLLQYLWKHKIFPLKPLQTVAGVPVEVIDTGLWNRDAGPDFFNAKLKIDSTLWVGNVEVHQRSSDWYRHGHDHDKAYDSVILHVVASVDAEVRRSDGEAVPQLLLNCPDQMREHYERLCHQQEHPACVEILPTLSRFTVHAWMAALQAERIDAKVLVLKAWLAHCNGDWEEAFFIALARNFGFGLNGDIFERWSKQLAFRAINKHRDNLFQVEAFFFGQAGLLADASGDTYYESLHREYLYLAHKFELPSPMDKSLWRLLRLRPGNFPYIRLAQLAYLYHRSENLFSQLMEADSLADLRALLSTRTSAYWETHFLFGKESKQQERSMGTRSVDLLILNTVVPFLQAYGVHKGDERRSVRAQQFMEELKAEENYITRKWRSAGIQIESAADSQALIQLEKGYCEKKKCLHCRFGYEFLKRK
ncbi:MAG: DUF2851 family protein [Bacteroidia bacterium]|nr:DUF2851 family protein [Bacteroidia bacterium]